MQMPPIVALIEKDLSEPYSIFTYRYFINNWPNLCFLVRLPPRRPRVAQADRARAAVQAMADGECVGTIVCKLDAHGRERVTHRGYIAMLAVRQDYRKKGIGATVSPPRHPRAPLQVACGRCCAGSSLVVMALDAMRTAHADEVRQLTGAAPARR